MVILTLAFALYCCWYSYKQDSDKRTQYEEIILKLDTLQHSIQNRKDIK